MYRRIPFAPAARVPAKTTLGVRVPPRPGGSLRMGNVSDYINTPGFPGSSTMFLYGMGQEPDVAPQSSGFDWRGLISSGTELVKTATTTVLPAVLQYEAYKANLERQKQGLAPLPIEQLAPQLRVQVAPDASTLRTAGFGIGTVALLGVGALAVWALTKRR